MIRDALEGAVAAHPVAPLVVRGWRETQSVGMLVLDDPDGGATRLREALRSRLVALRIPPAGPEPWLPHVTVVRHRRPSGAHVVAPTGRTLFALRPTGLLTYALTRRERQASTGAAPNEEE